MSESTLELISKVTEFNDLHEYMQDEQLDKALAMIVKLLMNPDVPSAKAPMIIIELQALSAKFAVLASYYTTIAKDKTGTPNNNKKNILIRVEEEEASYTSKSSKIIPIIQKIANDYKEENILVLARYTKQIINLRKVIGSKVKIIKMSFDGKYLLNNTDIFIGSGGTMTAESALMGVPTVSYNAVPNIVENFLVKKYLVKRETNPNKISNHIKKIFEIKNNQNQKRAKKILIINFYQCKSFIHFHLQ